MFHATLGLSLIDAVLSINMELKFGLKITYTVANMFIMLPSPQLEPLNLLCVQATLH